MVEEIYSKPGRTVAKIGKTEHKSNNKSMFANHYENKRNEFKQNHMDQSF